MWIGSEMRAVVVGAGLGGLCMAHGLHKAGVDVEVLEAHDGIHDFDQGYRININAAGHNALRTCLADEHFEAYERRLHRQRDPAVYLYSPAWRLLSRREVPAAPGAIDRPTVRRVLANGLAGRIRYGRKVASIADVGPADLIVAADGVGSTLRRELVPHAGPQPLGSSAIFGRSWLTAANRARTAPVILHSRFCGLVDGATVLALCAYDPPARTTNEPYVMWVLIGPPDELPSPGTPPAELVRFAEDRTASWDSRATSVLREANRADSFLAPLRSMTEIPDIPVHAPVPVAFLGDAIHAMSPAAGEGANTAFGDAALLLTHLQADKSITDAVAQYHVDMRVAATEALQRSASHTAKQSHV
jgi:2-polyprenyl-6-methoxyphenol hydroxylase-like FAD-dependent oxidoreductase